MTGRMLWWDLRSPDVEASGAFYGELLGWTCTPFEPWGLLVRRDGAGIGTLTRAEQVGPAATTMIYVQVDDLDAAMDRVRELGGTFVRGPIADGDGGRFVDVRDPVGCLVGLWTALPR